MFFDIRKKYKALYRTFLYIIVMVNIKIDQDALDLLREKKAKDHINMTKLASDLIRKTLQKEKDELT